MRLLKDIREVLYFFVPLVITGCVIAFLVRSACIWLEIGIFAKSNYWF